MMHRLPDGSGFFTATIYSERPPGFVNWLKYTKHPHARRWLFVWRMYRDARRGFPGAVEPMNPLRAFLAAVRCP